MQRKIDFEDKNFLTLIEAMKVFAESYAKSTSTSFCIEKDITQSVIIGLAKNKMESGSPLCPCRCYTNKEEEASFSYWNCPCVPMRERKECHCMLFIDKKNMFASGMQTIDIDIEFYKKKKVL